MTPIKGCVHVCVCGGGGLLCALFCCRPMEDFLFIFGYKKSQVEMPHVVTFNSSHCHSMNLACHNWIHTYMFS